MSFLKEDIIDMRQIEKVNLLKKIERQINNLPNCLLRAKLVIRAIYKSEFGAKLILFKCPLKNISVYIDKKKKKNYVRLRLKIDFIKDKIK